ncbi:hypothetical protein AKJ09_06386 [Labilithrix luteola]|uniref:Uncharacterized protein n=1 Tax=Labilithrix luteola TaxID=1391654 RepID=A0A0K1Q1W1_9BACT|nr:hypothetical protein AKJ09_06386 [Labilithrix luteola]
MVLNGLPLSWVHAGGGHGEAATLSHDSESASRPDSDAPAMYPPAPCPLGLACVLEFRGLRFSRRPRPGLRSWPSVSARAVEHRHLRHLRPRPSPLPKLGPLRRT